MNPDAVPFRDLGVAEVICTSLEASGIATTFPIQALTLPLAIGGHDIIGQARTGTGKTLAFGVPILHRLAADLAQGTDGADGATLSPRKAPFALIVLPTRELAIQVAAELNQAGKLLGARVLTVYGGRAYEPQIDALKAGTDVVVGTPGRLLDLADRKNLDLSQVRALVLDEADKMLDLGFLPDVEKILRLTPGDRQTMLFSATMPGEVVTLARRHMRRPTNIRAEGADEVAQIPPLTTQHVYRTHHLDKIEVLARVLQAKDRGLSMVFCQTKRAVDQVTAALDDRGFATAAVHGDLGQSQRERALRAFRSGKVDVLVATDVAARGIDVDDVTHVVNYECPDDEKTYVHRIGRTGRAGRQGVAVTFVDWADLQRWKLINAALGLDFPDPAETYSTSEHLYAELSIPPDSTGRLPVEMRGRAGLEAEAEEDLGETGRVRSKRSRSAQDERDGGRSGSRGRRRKNREQAAEPVAGGPDAARGDRHEADGETAPARSRRRRRLRSGQEVGQQAGPAAEQERAQGGGAVAEAPDATPADQGSAPRDSARQDNGRQDNAREDSGRQDSGRQDNDRQDATSTDAPRKRAARRGSARKDPADGGNAGKDAADPGSPEDTEDDDAFAAPIVASDPVTMPAAPGVPAVIFQAPL
ncbi:MAG TPA: DEAD/DEAH box helicase [Trebonia sp.]|nr:DEAD/DEAH box helicase [Trebonia sp.]